MGISNSSTSEAEGRTGFLSQIWLQGFQATLGYKAKTYVKITTKRKKGDENDGFDHYHISGEFLIFKKAIRGLCKR